MAAPRAQSVREGDEILLYTTHGRFKNPTRDRGRVMGRAVASSPVRVLDEPLHFGERAFTQGFHLQILGLARLREGVPLHDLVPKLTVFPDPATWSVRMRCASLQLPAADAHLLRTALDPLLLTYAEAASEYSQL